MGRPLYHKRHCPYWTLVWLQGNPLPRPSFKAPNSLLILIGAHMLASSNRLFESTPGAHSEDNPAMCRAPCLVSAPASLLAWPGTCRWQPASYSPLDSLGALNLKTWTLDRKPWSLNPYLKKNWWLLPSVITRFFGLQWTWVVKTLGKPPIKCSAIGKTGGIRVVAASKAKTARRMALCLLWKDFCQSLRNTSATTKGSHSAPYKTSLALEIPKTKGLDHGILGYPLLYHPVPKQGPDRP